MNIDNDLMTGFLEAYDSIDHFNEILEHEQGFIAMQPFYTEIYATLFTTSKEQAVELTITDSFRQQHSQCRSTDSITDTYLFPIVIEVAIPREEIKLVNQLNHFYLPMLSSWCIDGGIPVKFNITADVTSSTGADIEYNSSGCIDIKNQTSRSQAEMIVESIKYKISEKYQHEIESSQPFLKDCSWAPTTLKNLPFPDSTLKISQLFSLLDEKQATLLKEYLQLLTVTDEGLTLPEIEELLLTGSVPRETVNLITLSLFGTNNIQILFKLSDEFKQSVKASLFFDESVHNENIEFLLLYFLNKTGRLVEENHKNFREIMLAVTFSIHAKKFDIAADLLYQFKDYFNEAGQVIINDKNLNDIHFKTVIQKLELLLVHLPDSLITHLPAHQGILNKKNLGLLTHSINVLFSNVHIKNDQVTIRLNHSTQLSNCDIEVPIITTQNTSLSLTNCHLKSLTGYLSKLSFEKVSIHHGQFWIEQNSSLSPLTSLSGLSNLELNGKISDENSSYLTHLTTLKCLKFWQSGISNKALKHLTSLTNLTHLYLGGIKKLDQGAQYLKFLKSLQYLDLSHVHISNVGFDHISHLAQLKSLNLCGAKFPSECWPFFQRLSLLEKLDLGSTLISEGALEAISTLTLLNSLSLSQTHLNAEDMQHLRKLVNLKELDLSYSEIPSNSFACFRTLVNLNQLDLSQTYTTNHGLQQIKNLTQLTHLELSWNQAITDEGIRELANLKNLTCLNLQGTRVTSACLATMKNFEQLTHLNLRETRITDLNIEHISHLVSLTHLSLWETNISDSILDYIGTMEKIKFLDLAHTRVTSKGIKQLTLPYLEFLGLGSDTITDKSLLNLNGFKQLKYLDLCSTRTTPQGMSQLRLHLPNCKITKLGMFLELRSECFELAYFQ